MIPIEGSIVVDVTRREALSALPDAPVVADEHEPRAAGGRRMFLARILRSLADRLEPPRCVDHTLQPHRR
ncbi:MAG: hypothetical protein ACRDP3_21970 [Streptomyces sp.]|uniref:hypothetical protein n=1 Tax=Streptomyces sp. TaxID=1931 RepID=UPI003D6C3F06